MRLLYRKLEGVSPQKILDSMESSLEESIITDDKVEKRLREIEESKAREERDGKIISLSEEGVSQRKIAEMFHMSLRDVNQILKENDINTDGNIGNDLGNTEDPDTDKEK
jgi:predicted HTH domain antitoxin